VVACLPLGAGWRLCGVASWEQAVVINTYLSLFSSCVVSMIFSSLYSGQFKLDPVPIPAILPCQLPASRLGTCFLKTPLARIHLVAR